MLTMYYKFLETKDVDKVLLDNTSCKVRDIFAMATVNLVEYDVRSRDIREGPAIEPSPFKKNLRFKDQAEFRVVFIPRPETKISHKRLIIEIPREISPFEEVFRDFHP
jgi:hypothetical protein